MLHYRLRAMTRLLPHFLHPSSVAWHGSSEHRTKDRRAANLSGSSKVSVVGRHIWPAQKTSAPVSLTSSFLSR